MSYSTKMYYPEKVAELILKSGETIGQGDLIGYSSGWVLADASDHIFADWVALQSGLGGQKIKVCKKCMLYDEDAPYTADTSQYLGESGAITSSRSTAAGGTIQVVGKSIDTYRMMVDLN